MSHAAGFLDPLYSRGLSNTFEVVYSLCSRILDSLGDDDWSIERYEYVDRLERGLLKYNDDMVNSSYIAFSHYRLWNAVFRVWGGFLTPGVMRLTRALAQYELDHDDRHLRALEDCQYPGLWWPDTTFKQLLELTAETCEKYEAGEIDGDKAADILFKALDDCETLNGIFGWKDPESTRFVYPTTAMVAKFVIWAMRSAPDPELRAISRSLGASGLRSLLRGKKPL